jgi:hypothetical protein
MALQIPDHVLFEKGVNASYKDRPEADLVELENMSNAKVAAFKAKCSAPPPAKPAEQPAAAPPK